MYPFTTNKEQSTDIKQTLKNIVRGTAWTIICIYAIAFILPKIPVVQEFIGRQTSVVLADLFNTKVEIGNVDIRIPNRIIIDDVTIYDQHQKKMLRASRMSTSIDILPLLEGKISISAAQLFGMKALLYRSDANSPLNCQFFIDALSSKDTTDTAPLDLSIASLIIRNGSLQYDQYDIPQRRGVFSPAHVNISKLSSHIMLHKVTDDSLNISCKKLSLQEESGIILHNLQADFCKGRNGIDLNDFVLEMPGTKVSIPRISAHYALQGDSIKPGSLKFDGRLSASKITPSDFKALLPEQLLFSLPTMTADASAEGTDRAANATLSINSVGTEELSILASADIKEILLHPFGEALLSKLHVSESLISAASSIVNIPEPVKRIGSLDAKGRFTLYPSNTIKANADIITSRAGKLAINAEMDNNSIKGHIETPSLDIAQILNDNHFGNMKCDLDILAKTDSNSRLTAALMKGQIGSITYNDYTYNDINIDAEYANNTAKGKLSILDPNINLSANGSMGLGNMKSLNASIILEDFSPQALHLTDQFGHDRFALQLDADMKGSSVDNAVGSIEIKDISLTNSAKPEQDAFINSLMVTAENNTDEGRRIILNSDFADIAMKGDITVSQIPQSFINLLANELTYIPSIKSTKKNTNNFSIDAQIRNIYFVKRLLNLPVDIEEPITIDGFVNSPANDVNLRITAPRLNIDGTTLSGTDIQLWTPESLLRSTITTYLHQDDNRMRLSLDCTTDDNDIMTILSWDNMRDEVFRGSINTLTQFNRTIDGTTSLKVNIPISHFEVGDSLWSVKSNGIEYANGMLTVDRLSLGNASQYVTIDGIASESLNDSIVAKLHNINVAYIMNLINFHSVEFAGAAYGTATAKGALGDLQANAHLDVEHFLFEDGRMGTLHADALYSNATEQIDIDAICDDPTADAETIIKGNISPQRNTIDLGIRANNTRLEFMQTFCSSFIRDVDLHGSGDLRLHGLLSAINLEGKVVADGGFTLIPTNCRYALKADTVVMVPDDIQFHGIPIWDKNGNMARIYGGLHHHNLGRFTYDLRAVSDNLLVYDCPTLDGNSFCGSASIKGSVDIKGYGNELIINADATPLDGSYLIYDASSPDAISSRDFITWGSAREKETKRDSTATTSTDSASDSYANAANERTNIRMNFMVNTTPAARLHLLMDNTTGDYIDLFGNGVLRVSYYNKGKFEIFGNYDIDHGTYKMTIQNLIRKDFSFLKGGTIGFGGAPFDATLQLQAQYSLASVSLADLNIGSSFKSNNVPVNCLMNITGTPGTPVVDFSLNLPSLSSDARQMVYSIINSKEEMNQQVIYLLAIGRFYSEDNQNSGNADSYGQTSLAMQSFISGTISQQITTMMSNIIGSKQWSFGANIAPGNDGLNNMEYEGLLSGRLFNNRLLFNGQFGYRDNIQTNTQSFIGDFTLRYLLTPNGNVSLKVYNQTNDRYFTRNSLNTQGVGIVFQKEFGK